MRMEKRSENQCRLMMIRDIAISFIIGVLVGGLAVTITIDETHPFDKCMIDYIEPQNQIECVWLMRHGIN